MKLKTFLTHILPLLLSVSLPAHADELDYYSVNADTSAPGGESVTGTWTYDATNNTLVSAYFQQNDTVNNKTEIFNLSSNTTQFFAAPNTFTIQSYTDAAGDYWPGFHVQTLAAITQIGFDYALDSTNSKAYDFAGVKYYLSGTMTETKVEFINNVPEPTTIALLASALFGFAATRRKSALSI